MTVCVLGPMGPGRYVCCFQRGLPAHGSFLMVILEVNARLLWDMLPMGCDGECLLGPGVSVPYSRGSVGLGRVVVMP